jgi:hypothetical protein
MIQKEFCISWNAMKIRMKKDVLIHPFIFAIFPVLHLYSLNYYVYPPNVIVKPLIIIIPLTGVLLFLFNRIIKNYYKSGVVLSAFYLWFFSYDSIRSYLEITDLVFFRHRYLLVLYLILIVGIILLICKIRIDFEKLTKFLNIVSIFISLSIVFNFVLLYNQKKTDIVQEYTATINSQRILQKNNFPDIYYIILDAYTGARSLKEILGFDNSQFINSLQEKGFFIALSSHSNYAWTPFCIASTLNMEYLPIEMEKSDPSIFSLKKGIMFPKAISENKVVTFLKSIGYDYIDLSIWNGKHREIEFSEGLIRKTVLSVPYVLHYLNVLLARKYILDSINALEMLQETKKPTFIYAHIMIPHPPFAFDKDGRKTLFFAKVKEGYLDQILYVNKRIMKIIDGILMKSKTKPIIIIQGDHGINGMTDEYGERVSYEKSVKLRMNILNAYYLPDNGEKQLYDSISPVNSFRVILNKYFNTDYKLLPDRSYFSEKESGKLYDINYFE